MMDFTTDGWYYSNKGSELTVEHTVKLPMILDNQTMPKYAISLYLYSRVNFSILLTGHEELATGSSSHLGGHISEIGRGPMW